MTVTHTPFTLKHTLTRCLVALARPLLVQVQGEQEVRVPPGLLVARCLAAPPRCQGGVQEERRPLGVGCTKLRLVLQLKEEDSEST